MTAILERDAIRAAEERTGFDRMATLLRYFAGWMQDHRAQVQISYLIPERSGYGWYVIAKEQVFDYDLNKQLADFGEILIRKGYAIHVTLLPGSIPPTVPTDGIVVTPSGQVTTYAD